MSETSVTIIGHPCTNDCRMRSRWLLQQSYARFAVSIHITIAGQAIATSSDPVHAATSSVIDKMERTADHASNMQIIQPGNPRNEEDRLIKLVLDADSDAETIIDSGSDSEDGTKDWARGLAQRAFNPYIKHTVKKGQFMYVKPAFKQGRHFYVNEELERIRTENHEADLKRQLKGAKYKVTGTVVFDRHGEPKDFQVDNIIPSQPAEVEQAGQPAQDKGTKQLSPSKIKAHHVDQRAVLSEAASRIEQARDVRDVATETVKVAVASNGAQKPIRPAVVKAMTAREEVYQQHQQQYELGGRCDGIEAAGKTRRSNHASPRQGNPKRPTSQYDSYDNEDQETSRQMKAHHPRSMSDDASDVSSAGGRRNNKFTAARAPSIDEASDISDGGSQYSKDSKQQPGQESKQEEDKTGACGKAQGSSPRSKNVVDPRARMRQRKSQIYSTSEEDEEVIKQRRKGREAERAALREKATKAGDAGDCEQQDNTELFSDSDKDAPLGKAAASRANQIVLSKPAAKTPLKNNTHRSDDDSDELDN